jgi:diguanylate cyclase (GGDEF)-like protein
MSTVALEEVIQSYHADLARFVKGAFQDGSPGSKRVEGFAQLRGERESAPYPMSPNIALAGPVGREQASLINAIASQDYRKALESEWNRSQARYDELTGLDNRRSIERLLTDATKSNSPGLAVMYDLDGFKSVNDTQGHETGDQLLREVAAVLREYVRPYDAVDFVGTVGEDPLSDGHIGRLGGDEFLVVLRDVDETVGAARAAQINEHLNEVLAPYGAGSSFGYAVIEPGADPNKIKNEVDRRMYENKRSKGVSR